MKIKRLYLAVAFSTILGTVGDASAAVTAFPNGAGADLTEWLNRPGNYLYFDDSYYIGYNGGASCIIDLGCNQQIGYYYWSLIDGIGGCSCTIGGAVAGAMSTLRGIYEPSLAGTPYIAQYQPEFAILGKFIDYSTGNIQVWYRAVVPDFSDGAVPPDEDPDPDPDPECKKVPSTKLGNPIDLATGSKTQAENDFDVLPAQGVQWKRYFSSAFGDSSSLGQSWTSSYSRRLQFLNDGDNHSIKAIRDDGSSIVFNKSGSTWVLLGKGTSALSQAPDGRWILTAPSGAEIYGTDGALVSVSALAGGRVDIGRDSKGNVGTATDLFGRQLTLGYDSQGVVLKTVTLPDNQQIAFDYRQVGATLNLSQVNYQNLDFKKYLYEDTRFPSAITGIVDENGDRFATWTYDSRGNAVESSHGAAAVIDKVSVANPGASPVNYTDALGTPRTSSIAGFAGRPRVTAQSKPGGSGCSESAASLAYDTSGYPISKDDFTGKRTCFAEDPTSGFVIRRVEGLAGGANGVACSSVIADGAQLPAGARKISVNWHPRWPLRTQMAQPKKITTWVYNNRPDPVEGGTASCASAAPDLPDGNKIAVVCRRYEQATTDETGSLGFNATVTETRKWSYNYDQYGHVLDETGPSGQISGKKTIWEYWNTTSFPDGVKGHQSGDLKSVTNTLGQKKNNYLEYNKLGQPLTIQEASGQWEYREYHPRGWPAKVTRRPADAVDASRDSVTQYEYYPTGLLKKVTRPDSSFSTYTWDDAHRLVAIEESSGNRVDYVLDNAGNVLEEKVRDPSNPSGPPAKKVTRIFDSLGRMSSETGAP